MWCYATLNAYKRARNESKSDVSVIRLFQVSKKAREEGTRGIMDEPNGLLIECRNRFLVMVKGRWGIWEALGIPYDTSMNNKVLTAGRTRLFAIRKLPQSSPSYSPLSEQRVPNIASHVIGSCYASHLPLLFSYPHPQTG